MNKHLYRIIFNKKRGTLMAVAETATGDGKATGTSMPTAAGSPCVAMVRPLVFSILLALGLAGFIPNNAHAQIVAYKTAPANQQPTILSAGNGVPLINIQTPSAAGVSRNTYSQFDVQQQGAILNNAHTNAKTQLGGWVQGNPWLARGTARVILNEVIAANPSQLLGYVEVAGDRAQVVIANPAGVTCNGCGFINAGRVTLTTGTPILSGGGNLDGYRVEGGTVRVDGSGMDASGAGYTDLIARAVEINAGLWAQNLSVTTGANQVNAAHTQATPIAGSGAAPAFAVDVAQLGGMYANKITLVGTEAGVGVRNAGLIGASAGDVIISTDGKLSNNGAIFSSDSTRLSSNGGIGNAGTIYANRNASLSTQGDIDNTASLIRAGQTLNLSGARINNRDTQGTDQGIEGGSLNVTATQIDNTRGALRADDALTLASSGTVNNTNGLVSSAGTLTIQDTAPHKTLAVVNAGGVLIADQMLAIDSASLTNNGRILGVTDIAIKLTADTVQDGEITANRNTRIETSGLFTNNSIVQAGNTLDLSAATLNNAATGTLLSTRTHLTATDSHTLVNRGLIDGSDTFIDSIAVSNLGTGRIYGDHVAIAATTLTNEAETIAGTTSAPVIAARTRLDIGAGTIDNREHALLFSAGDLAIGGALDTDHRATGQAGALNNVSATIEALGQLGIHARQINNLNAHLATQDVITSNTSITEYQGSGAATRYLAGTPGVYIYDDESDHLHTPERNYEEWLAYRYTRTTVETQVSSTDPGKILSGGEMNINADTLLNDNSQIIAGGTLTATATSLENRETTGERTITDAGTVTSYWRDHEKGRDSTGSSTAAYHPPATIQTISLGTTVYRTGTPPDGSGTSIPGIVEIGAGGQAVRSTTPNLTLPDNSLYHRSQNPTAHYLIETDPAFASYRTWLTSDYMLQQLSIDPATTQKRLGDGFYEQRLIREQIAQLTGRRFLDGYADDEAQYMALMNAGVTVAQTWHLRPGVALTAEQMAGLTSDIVWLVEKTVTLADGTTQQVLVPQVYARVQSTDLAPSGALIAANDLDLNLTGDLTNAGTIAGRRIVSLSADNIQNLGGRIAGQSVGLTARTDLTNLGGTVQASDTLLASAGHNLTLTSTTRTQDNANGSRTNLDRVAGLYVTGKRDGSGGTLVASAGNDIALLAAALINTYPTAAGTPGSAGTTALIAGRNLNLGTLTEANSNQLVWDGKNKRDDAHQSDVGSTIQSTGDLWLQAGHDLTAKAASVTSDTGALVAYAGHDLSLTAGSAADQVDERHQHREQGLLSSKTRTTRDTLDSTQALASSFSGETTELVAGQDIHITGSNVVATGDLTVQAGRNLDIDAASETHRETHFKKTTQSGIFSTGGVGVTLGSKMLSTDQQSTGTTAAASTIGSLEGDITLQAGNAYRQVGSDVIALAGDIDLRAQTVDILDARETNRTTYETRTKQSGLTLAITSPIISAIQTVQQMSDAARDTKDSRMQLLAAANVGLSAYNTYDAIKTGQGATMKQPDGSFKDNQINTGTVDADGKAITRDANVADQIGGINLSISLGTSKSQSKTTQTSDTAVGSTLQAGGDLKITATGGADSDITIRGSKLTAGQNLSLSADDEIKLLAAANRADQHSTNTSNSASVGISIGTDGLLFNVGASAGRGKADGADLAWTNSQVSAGETLTLKSGGDTTLQGAVAQGKQVVADIGGDLKIESLQDTSTYDSKQKSGGFSLSVGYGRIGGSVSISQSDIKSDYASVTEQSGIKAGDGGFDIQVAGDTDLKGALIASSQHALDAQKNHFQTGGTLTTSDIQNHAEYEAESMSLGIGSSMSQGKFKPGGSAGYGEDEGQAESTTRSGITGIAGNTDIRTGDPQTGIAKIFDQETVQKEIDAQTKITQTFGQLAPKAAADFAASQAADLRKQNNEEEAKKWDEGGIYRIALHTAIGGLAGDAPGALGAGAAASAAPLLNEFQSNITQSLKDAGANDKVAGIAGQLISGSTAMLIGSAASGGNVVGGVTAFNADVNNRQLHPDEARIIAANAKKYAEKQKISLQQAVAELTQQAEQNIDTVWDERLGSDNPAAQAFLKEIGLGQSRVDPMTGQTYQLFAANAEQRDNHAMFSQYSTSNPLVKAELDLAMNKAYLPKDAQAIAGVNGSNPGTISGSDLALNDAAKDYGNMRSQPAVVQQSVLAELRATRLDIARQEAVLLNEFKTLPLTPENRDRRADLQSQIDRLETRDFFLLKATQAQILDMGSVGLLNPLNQAETVEGLGDALGGARLSGKGVTSASISGRINMLKGAVEEAKAAAAAEKAIAQAKVENGVNADAHFAGGVPIRPKDGVVEPGTAQIDTPIAKHLIDAEIKLNKQGQPTSVSGGHNMDNFNQALQANGGQVIGTPKEVAPGIYQVEYRLPGTKQNEIEIKTVYDPAKYSDAQMASMANEAVGRAIYQWKKTGTQVPDIQFVEISGIKFEVPISIYRKQVYVPTAYPSGNK